MRTTLMANNAPAACAAGTLILFLCLATGCAKPPVASGGVGLPEPGKDALRTSELYGLLTWDNKALFNNCWGQGLIKRAGQASSSVFYDPAARLCGWRWSWPEESVSELKGYPSLIVGDKVHMPAGWDPSTDARFPLRLSDIKTLRAAAEIRVAGRGAYDFAYDLAFLEGPLSAPEAVRSEIMIWLAASFNCPANREGTFSVEGRTYDLFVNIEWNPRAPYLAFVLRGTGAPDSVPLHEFIRIGIERGYVDAAAWLAAIELGPEIWWGDGEASVRDFRVSLNGD